MSPVVLSVYRQEQTKEIFDTAQEYETMTYFELDHPILVEKAKRMGILAIATRHMGHNYVGAEDANIGDFEF